MGPTREMDTDLRASEREPKVDSAILMIVADDRERRGGVIECLEEMTDVRVEVQRIEEGDFVVERQFVVERKTLRDFAQSLLDGRLFRQASRLAQSSLRRVLVLEGKAEDLRACNVTRDSLQGALITVGVFYGIPILRAMDPAETARLIVYLARQARRVARPASSADQLCSAPLAHARGHDLNRNTKGAESQGRLRSRFGQDEQDGQDARSGSFPGLLASGSTPAPAQKGVMVGFGILQSEPRPDRGRPTSGTDTARVRDWPVLPSAAVARASFARPTS